MASDPAVLAQDRDDMTALKDLLRIWQLDAHFDEPTRACTRRTRVSPPTRRLALVDNGMPPIRERAVVGVRGGIGPDNCPLVDG